MLPINKLRSFVAVAEQSSFRSAAETIGITQPALSLQISELEKALGVSLFHRTTRRVELTNEGARLLARAKRILFDLDTIAQDLQDEAGLERGRVVVSCVPTMGAGLFATALARFARQHPNVNVQLVDETTVEMTEKVERGDVDFGLGPEPSAADDLQFERLATDSFLVICPRDSEMARRTALKGRELSRLPLVTLVRSSNVGSITAAYFEQIGADYRPRYEVNHHYTLGGFVRAGLGFGILPQQALALTGDPSLVGIPIIQPKCTRTIGVVTRRGDRLSPAASAFLAAVRATIAAGHETRDPS